MGSCLLGESANPKSSGSTFRQILLTYLRVSRVVGWPGGDGLTEDDILDYYPRASAAGEVPDLQELCHRHSQLVAEIRTFFTSKGWLGNNNSQ
jgi:hypothetical protein